MSKREPIKVNNSLSTAMGYNPYRDSEGKFDDGPVLLASRGRPKIDSTEQRKKIDQAKERLRAKFAVEDTKPERDKVLEGPQYMETIGFAINEKNLSDNDTRTILWKDKELFPGKTYGEYYAENKARKGDIFMMTPGEYRQALVESGQYTDLESIEGRMDWDKVDQYTEDMMSGDKFPPGQLIYNEDGSTQQEGLHRIYAAERVGIEKVPVVVSSDTRNQDIYPYKELSDSILLPDQILGGGSYGGDGGSGTPPIDPPFSSSSANEPEEVDNEKVKEAFYGISSLGGEHASLLEKKKDPAITFTEEESIDSEIAQVEKDMRAETDKVLDAIKSAPASSSFLEELATTIETEQEIANKNGDELYLTALDKIVLAIGKKQSNKDSVKAEPKAVESNISDATVERFSAFNLEAQSQDTLNSAILNKEYKKALADTRKELSSITGAAGGRWSSREDADFIKSVSLKNKPQQVSDDEFEAMKNSGDYITLYRNAGKPEYIEAFKNGENPVNPYHMYGTGVYFAVDKNFASGGQFAEGSEPEAIFEALIPKDKFSERPEGWERKDLSSDVAYLAKDGKGAQREVAQTAADQNLTSILSGKAGVHIPNNDRYSDDPFSSEQFVITNPAHMIVRGDS